jgi:hypothetical protein
MADQPREEDLTAGSILRELVFNQYQAIVLGGSALASLLTANPLPLLVWLGSELVLLPILDSGPLRRLVNRRKLAAARAGQQAAREQLVEGLSPDHARRYAAIEHLCGLVENNYQSLTGISQAYLAEQRAKLDQILQGCLNRLQALQRYERMPAHRTVTDIEDEVASIREELTDPNLPERARAALQKNVELKERLRASVAQVDDTVRTLATEIDSMEALVEVLHQNSMSLRDPQAIAQELDNIVRQSEESERAVREMETLLRADVDGGAFGIPVDVSAAPKKVDGRQGPASTPSKVRGR